MEWMYLLLKVLRLPFLTSTLFPKKTISAVLKVKLQNNRYI